MRPVARRFRLPRHLRVPFAGKAFLLITLGIGVAAINTGNNLLYLALSLNLSLILLSGVLSEGTLRHVALKVRLASEAFAGGEAFLAVTCSTEGKRFPGISLVAILRTGDDPTTVRFPDIAPGTSVTRVVPFRPVRTGESSIRSTPRSRRGSRSPCSRNRSRLPFPRASSCIPDLPRPRRGAKISRSRRLRDARSCPGGSAPSRGECGSTSPRIP